MGRALERLYAEMSEQPEVARRLIDAPPSVLETVARSVRAAPPRAIVLVARGSSDHAATFGRYLFEVRNRALTSLAAPSAFTLYGSGPDLRDTLVIAVSQSGRGEDVIAVIRAARRAGARTLAIVNDTASPLASEAEWVVDIAAGPEESVPATKTVLAQMTVLALLSSRFGVLAKPDERARATTPGADGSGARLAVAPTAPGDRRAPDSATAESAAGALRAEHVRAPEQGSSARAAGSEEDARGQPGAGGDSRADQPRLTVGVDACEREAGAAPDRTTSTQSGASGDVPATPDERSPTEAASLAALPDALGIALSREAEVRAYAQELAQVEHLFVVGRGFAYPIALETALKFEEMARLHAGAWSSADFLHGPVTLVGPAHPVLALDAGGRSTAQVLEAVRTVADRGARPLLLRVGRIEASAELPALTVACDLEEHHAAMVLLVLGQLLAREVAVARGLDPATPPGLTKVTSTR
ncbi:MAG: SIS domain-containing protein [Myxococcaceae bacterium]|nr:SIS domain-containing protein [Myxococcaceae bacterium]